MADLTADDTAAATALALAAVERLAAPGLRVLDAGCGAGPLAQAAAARGAIVRAVDRDPDAVARARARGLAAELGRIEDLGGDYELVLANLWADDLVALAPQLIALVAPGGILYATGALLAQRDAVERAFSPALALRRLEARGGWCGLELVRPSWEEDPSTTENTESTET